LEQCSGFSTMENGRVWSAFYIATDDELKWSVSVWEDVGLSSSEPHTSGARKRK
jgi:hypothetical protein